MTLYVVGNAVMIESGLMLLPLITALIYKEQCVTDFLITMAIALASGFVLRLISSGYIRFSSA